MSLPGYVPPAGGVLTVFYNTKCPVCDAGIHRQDARLRAAKVGTVVFEDIDRRPRALTSLGVTVEDVRRRLHGTDEAGALHVGVDCAVEVWRRSPGDRWIASVAGSRLVRPLARFAYDRFADALYAWNRRRGHW